MKLLKKMVIKPFQKALGAFGYVLEKRKNLEDFYLHEYSSYEEYKRVQIYHNKRKINSIWADVATLNRVGQIVSRKFNSKPIKGLCHGTRNGYEQNYLSNLDLGIDAIGTDISETAQNYEKSITWDFHDPKPEWKGMFDFIYTNSLDQSWKPKRAIEVWLDQLNMDGVLIIEHTEAHGPREASKMDPFGVRPTVFPYILTMWFGSQISISHSVAKKGNNNIDAWLFVVHKNVTDVRSLGD